MFNINTTYLSLSEKLYSKSNPVAVISPKLCIKNDELLKELGIEEPQLEEYLSGNRVIPHSTPIALAYMGHQFGVLNMLGDGRAHLLGEHVTPNGKRFDIQLKGSGRTIYSRNGDGRGSLYSMFREYVVSNAMYYLGVPTTRALAVVATGEKVYRNNGLMGGIVTRVASSHIRVGTFVYAVMHLNQEEYKEFVDYVIERHFPYCLEQKNPYLSLLEEVMKRQIDLIIHWYCVGFIHGVMNTDNVSICGETIDYGPCAFMDIYNPATVFSSIDHWGRYSFENQRDIGGWNLARFAETLIPLVDPHKEQALEHINAIMSKYQSTFEEQYYKMMFKKIGIVDFQKEDYPLIDSLLELMKMNQLDYTKTFRNLKAKEESTLIGWYKKWDSFSIDYTLMDRVNPTVIPRNHIVEEVIDEAGNKGNIAPLTEFLNILQDPYNDDVDEYYKNPPKVIDPSYQTFCGT